MQTETETVAIPFSTEKSESDEYDFGKTVTLQEGVDGLEDVTYEITMIDGEVTDRQAVSYNVDQIGEVGSTGISSGNHCHFEMYYNNVLFSAQTLFGGM